MVVPVVPAVPPWVPLMELSVRLEGKSAGGYINEIKDEVHTGPVVATLLLITHHIIFGQDAYYSNFHNDRLVLVRVSFVYAFDSS